MIVKIKINSRRAMRRFDRLDRQADSLPWMQAGEIVRTSVHRNFDEGGRPVKWQPRKVDRPWPILRKSGDLRNAHYVESIPNGVAIGNRIVYQAVHNFGYPPRNIPQREYLMVQPEDLQGINDLFRKYLARGI